ncbi:hypothetical protein Avbf_18462 [Armadillidium vulgare]|nr:hypothetical protein Avbf_18462 [Armadillidium vulgare]
MHSIYKCMSHEHIYRDAPPLTYIEITLKYFCYKYKCYKNKILTNIFAHQRKEEKFLEVKKEKVNLIKSNLKRQSEEEIEKLKILREKITICIYIVPISVEIKITYLISFNFSNTRLLIHISTFIIIIFSHYSCMKPSYKA